LAKGSPIDVGSLGYFDEKNVFSLKKGDHSKIFTHFKPFYVHRVQFVGLDESQKNSLFNSYDPLSNV
jgi:hypothetical protein